MGYTAIVDYGVGNLKSVSNAMAYIGRRTLVTGDPGELEKADAVILPGVGAFPDAAERLCENGLNRVVASQAGRKPILGICLGMQLLFDQGMEVKYCKGLGLVSGSVERIKTKLKLPHIGWNSLIFPHSSPLFHGLDDGTYVYFVHSYYAAECDPWISAQTEYGTLVTAAAENKNVFGTQFHPEKSGAVGLKILKAFCEI